MLFAFRYVLLKAYSIFFLNLWLLAICEEHSIYFSFTLYSSCVCSTRFMFFIEIMRFLVVLYEGWMNDILWGEKKKKTFLCLVKYLPHPMFMHCNYPVDEAYVFFGRNFMNAHFVWSMARNSKLVSPSFECKTQKVIRCMCFMVS